MTRLLRPALTLFLTLGLFAATTYLVLVGKLEASIYLTSWLNIVLMMIAFFFGERSALKNKDEEK